VGAVELFGTSTRAQHWQSQWHANSCLSSVLPCRYGVAAGSLAKRSQRIDAAGAPLPSPLPSPAGRGDFAAWAKKQKKWRIGGSNP
jgi:hypothetical protein